MVRNPPQSRIPGLIPGLGRLSDEQMQQPTCIFAWGKFHGTWWANHGVAVRDNDLRAGIRTGDVM